MPYGSLFREDLPGLPKPFVLRDLPPDNEIGFVTKDREAFTNIIELPDSFGALGMDPDLRKDLRRIERKNEGTKLVEDEKDSLDRSKHWFRELWHEEHGEFERRLKLWKEKAYTVSAYRGEELLGVHIAMEESNAIYYLGCWWNREHKNLSVPTFLLKRDIERAIAKGLKTYDLGIGQESYKKQWGVVQKPTKYYAEITPEMAEVFKMGEFVEIGEGEFMEELPRTYV